MFGCRIAHPSFAIFIPRHYSIERHPVFILIVRLPLAPPSDRSSQPSIIRKYICEREGDDRSIAVASSPLISAQIKPPPGAFSPPTLDFSLYYISNQPSSVHHTLTALLIYRSLNRATSTSDPTYQETRYSPGNTLEPT